MADIGAISGNTFKKRTGPLSRSRTILKGDRAVKADAAIANVRVDESWTRTWERQRRCRMV